MYHSKIAVLCADEWYHLRVLSQLFRFSRSPHRGFETVSYVLRGAIEHEDFSGHRGIIR